MIDQPTPSVEIDLPPERHPLWLKFEDYAGTQGISLDHEYDWMPWWDCFITGVEAARSKHNVK